MSRDVCEDAWLLALLGSDRPDQHPGQHRHGNPMRSIDQPAIDDQSNIFPPSVIVMKMMASEHVADVVDYDDSPDYEDDDQTSEYLQLEAAGLPDASHDMPDLLLGSLGGEGHRDQRQWTPPQPIPEQLHCPPPAPKKPKSAPSWRESALRGPGSALRGSAPALRDRDSLPLAYPPSQPFAVWPGGWPVMAPGGPALIFQPSQGLQAPPPAAHSRHSHPPQNDNTLSPEIKHCANCGSTQTPSWRRCPRGKDLLCNACGLYAKLHHRPRPFRVAEDGSIRVMRLSPEQSSTGWRQEPAGRHSAQSLYSGKSRGVRAHAHGAPEAHQTHGAHEYPAFQTNEAQAYPVQPSQAQAYPAQPSQAQAYPAQPYPAQAYEYHGLRGNQVCANCLTDDTPCWRRRMEDGVILCNACALYQRGHGRPRPRGGSSSHQEPMAATAGLMDLPPLFPLPP